MSTRPLVFCTRLTLIIAPLAALVACSNDPAPTDLSADAGPDAPLTDTAPDLDASVDADTDAPPLITGELAIDLVAPLMGTSGIAFGYAALSPAVQVPFGLARLGPDTSIANSAIPFHHFSGYHGDDTDLFGFSHLHFIGTGVVDYGNLRVLPLTDANAPPGRHHTALARDTEVASPGYYAVYLPEEGVLAELTATAQGGLHRYTFDETDTPAFLNINAGASVSGDDVIESQITLDGNILHGYATHAGAYTGRTRPFTLYFDIELSRAPDDARTWREFAFDPVVSAEPGQEVGISLTFNDASTPIELRVGLSLVDHAAARANRLDQLDGRSFDEVHAAARELWREKLHRVRLKGADDHVARTFYTSLYNAYRMPSRQNGADHRYRGIDGDVHSATTHAYYTDLSLWDTFRTLHPWLTLTDPDEQRAVLLSMEKMREQGGFFPRWPAAISYTNGMLGTWAEALFAEGALKGIEGPDYNAALEGVVELAMAPTPEGHPYSGRPGIEDYIALGFVPDDRHGSSVSRTLEYAWGDFAIAQLARHLGQDQLADNFDQRALSSGNVFHPESLFPRPRNADGSFNLDAPPEQVYMSGGPFTEGNAWHWRFYGLHSPDHLVERFGGQAPLYEALLAFFENSALADERPVDTRVVDTYYWHGNEPAIHAALLFHAAGSYDQLAHWVRQIQTRLYTDGPPGNDDGGTLSSWYLFNALGIYPVAGSDRYLASIPLTPYAEVDTAGGTLKIVAPGAAPRNQRVRALTLNGQPVDPASLTHADLQNATLHFELDDLDD
ncbi:GH92 family glycosyl hydrolase [Lujinxingia vulgaris]|nr:GH92 family glycosyl hydrolase [Lujinxingia vulgaris]